MGEGNSRLAYRCRVRGGCYRGYTEGSYCIIKVFKNQAREPKKEARRFINDTVRNDFHKKFLNKYIK